MNCMESKAEEETKQEETKQENRKDKYIGSFITSDACGYSEPQALTGHKSFFGASRKNGTKNRGVKNIRISQRLKINIVLRVKDPGSVWRCREGETRDRTE